jgi:hypothetical protein
MVSVPHGRVGCGRAVYIMVDKKQKRAEAGRSQGKI